MDYRNVVSIFRELEPNLVDTIQLGYSTIFESEIEPREIVAYHGTNDKFNVFDADKTMDGCFWFSTDKNSIIAGQSGAVGTKYIMKCLLTMTKTAGWDEYDKYSVDELMRDGYDSVKLDDDYIIFKPNQIKVISSETTK